MIQVVSIQSQLVYGYAGNSAAVFPIQRSGITVASVPTALLSNNPHYPTTYGKIFEADFVADLLKGLEERNVINERTIILTGYLGSLENAKVVHDFILRMRKRFPLIRYVCDPVMGDHDLRTFVPEELVSYFKKILVPLANLITPNQYELELITQKSCRTSHELHQAALLLDPQVIATGCYFEDTFSEDIESVLVQEEGLIRFPKKKIPIRPVGTGDFFTANIVIGMIQEKAMSQTCQDATEEIHKVLSNTPKGENSEMSVVENLKIN